MTTLKNCFVLLLVLAMGCVEPDAVDEQVADSETPEVTADSEASTDESSEDDQVIVFLGDSITAGYGVDNDEAFPEIVRHQLDNLGYTVDVRNAGVSGETSAGGLRRIDWVLRQDVDILVVELGGNDGLRGVPIEETESNLVAIVETARELHPEVDVLLAGMQLPPNLGREYTTAFANIFPSLAKRLNTHLIPFILKDVAGDRDLNQRDGIHPTAEGHQIIAKTAVDALIPILDHRISGD